MADSCSAGPRPSCDLQNFDTVHLRGKWWGPSEEDLCSCAWEGLRCWRWSEDEEVGVCISLCTVHAVHKVHKLQCISNPVWSTGAVNYSTLASFQTRRPRSRATITLALSISLSPSFYFNESTINKEMEQPPKGGWFFHNGSLLLSMAVLNSPPRPLGHTEGHLQYRPTSLAPSLSLILKVS